MDTDKTQMKTKPKQDWSAAQAAVQELQRTLAEVEQQLSGKPPVDPGAEAFEMLFGKQAKFKSN